MTRAARSTVRRVMSARSVSVASRSDVFSARTESSMSPTKRDALLDSPTSNSLQRATRSGRCSASRCSDCANAEIPATGVRSSCAASARKRRMSSSARRAARAAEASRRSASSRASSISSTAEAVRPRSVFGLVGSSRLPLSPLVIRRATDVIESSGDSARRTAKVSAAAASSSVTAPAPSMRMRSCRRTSAMAVVSPRRDSVEPSGNGSVISNESDGGAGGSGGPGGLGVRDWPAGGAGVAGRMSGPGGPLPGAPYTVPSAAVTRTRMASPCRACTRSPGPTPLSTSSTARVARSDNRASRSRRSC